jgi:hypothetical protein
MSNKLWLGEHKIFCFGPTPTADQMATNGTKKECMKWCLNS